MKFLQIGLGSMGKRRIRNLLHLGEKDITGFDIRDDRRTEANSLYGIKTISSLEKLEWNQFSHVIISTPPDLHAHYAIIAAKLEKNIFIEASVIDEDLDALEKLANKNFVISPSCTMRFDPIVAKAKEIIDSGALGKLIFANHYFGQYLPDWHPYENIRDFYVSKRQTGAAREIVPFDLVYITWLCGFPKTLTSLITNSKTLGVDIDDVYSVLYQTDENVQVTFTVDVVSRFSYRDTRLIFSEGNLTIDNVNGSLSLFDGKTMQGQVIKRDSLAQTFSREEMYVLEMKAFLDATNGKRPFPYSLKDDRRILKILRTVEESFDQKSIINV